MAEKEIALLKKQQEKLTEKSFDLEAWKNQTTLFLQRIFGADHNIVKMIADLKYDYSSWTLRDATGNEKTDDPVKMQADEILEAAIMELENLGLPQQESSAEKAWELMEEELTGKQFKEIKAIIDSGKKNKLAKVQEVLNRLEKENLISILSRILIS
ncbi:hypothetical protein [Sunxiuqinia dokdonensis]|uniref:Uncharacterized protein n=1 Tax=Sunxiuqinia dokdonensis TaxID=1409788 RepID=A0A0L8V3Z0_9BACT|nr:hypothetical protein [Sunxiuqinia dokdonensis]KOH42957.1 hypothetical protein NC99_41730 [Sunxiuqinia dokdonensis]